MANLDELKSQIQQITAQLQASEAKQQALEKQLMGDDNERAGALGNKLQDIETILTSDEQIQLESYKAIPEFSGKINEYRSWRNQVTRRMKIIDKNKRHWP